MTTAGPMLLAEELLLLFLDDDSGALRADGTSVDYALGGAVLLELVLAEQVHLTGQGGFLRKQRVEVTAGASRWVDDPVLAKALEQTAHKARSAESLVPALSKGLREELLARLVQRGVLRHEKGRILGIFPTNRWPATDRGPEAITRGRLHEVLVAGREPDVRTAALVSLLSAVDQAHKVLGDLDRSTAKAVKERAKRIAEGEWVPRAVRKAVEAVQAATMAAAVAATSAATIAST